MDRSTVSRNLTVLLKHDWIEVVSSDAKGAREVALTTTGRKKIESVMPDWRRAQDQAAQLLGAQGAETVKTIASTLSPLPGE